MHGGSFVYDPWVLYAAGVLNDANMLVIGRPGHGKSALVKTWMYRSRVFGRVCELIDPKGEYAPARPPGSAARCSRSRRAARRG